AVREPFLTAWRAQNGLYIDYAFGAATHDDTKKGVVLASLNDARGTIDAALTGANGRWQPGTVAELLRPQVRQIVGAMDAFAAGDAAGGYAALRAATDGVPALADPIAVALSAQPSPTSAPSSAAASPAGPAVSATPAARACNVPGPA